MGKKKKNKKKQVLQDAAAMAVDIEEMADESPGQDDQTVPEQAMEQGDIAADKEQAAEPEQEAQVKEQQAEPAAEAAESKAEPAKAEEGEQAEVAAVPAQEKQAPKRAPQAGMRVLVAVLLFALLSLIGIFVFLQMDRPFVNTFSQQQLVAAQSEGGGFFISHPESFSQLGDASGLSIANEGHGIMIRFEDVAAALGAHLDAGYAQEEAMEALFHAGREYLSGGAVVSNYTVDEALNEASFGFTGTNGEELYCYMRIYPLEESLVFSSLLCGKTDEQEALPFFADIEKSLVKQ